MRDLKRREHSKAMRTKTVRWTVFVDGCVSATVVAEQVLPLAPISSFDNMVGTAFCLLKRAKTHESVTKVEHKCEEGIDAKNVTHALYRYRKECLGVNFIHIWSLQIIYGVSKQSEFFATVSVYQSHRFFGEIVLLFSGSFYISKH